MSNSVTIDRVWYIHLNVMYIVGLWFNMSDSYALRSRLSKTVFDKQHYKRYALLTKTKGVVELDRHTDELYNYRKDKE